MHYNESNLVCITRVHICTISFPNSYFILHICIYTYVYRFDMSMQWKPFMYDMHANAIPAPKIRKYDIIKIVKIINKTMDGTYVA